MRGQPVGATNHVARHCRAKDYDNTKGELLATAFELRSDEDSVSANCPECFPALPDLTTRLRKILHDLTTKPAKRTIRSSHWFAIVGVHKVTAIQTSADAFLSVRHDPEEGDDSHCGIYGLVGLDPSELNALQLAIGVCAVGPPVSVADLK